MAIYETNSLFNTESYTSDTYERNIELNRQTNTLNIDGADSNNFFERYF